MLLSSGTALGKGYWHSAGSVDDTGLLTLVQSYRRRVVGAYRSVKPEEIATSLFGGPFHVSPKVDGELWFLHLSQGDATLFSNHGKAISGDLPLLAEVRPLAQGLDRRVVIAGELFAASAGKGRPRVGDVAVALAGEEKAPVERLGFMAFDLLEGLLPHAPQLAPYEDRYKALADLFSAGKRVKAIRTDSIAEASSIPAIFSELVEGGKAEGLVVRSALGAIYKIKPEFTIDTTILGYTARTEDPSAVRTLLVGLTREDGTTQIAGHCGNLGDDESRRQLMQRLAPLICASSFRCPSRSGDMFTFVRPELVAEIRVTDVQPETSDGQATRFMTLDYQTDVGWSALSPMPSASLLHPVLVRLRDDKKPNSVDTRITQILERCAVDQIRDAVSAVDLPRSEIVRREVWTKSTKGKTAVRKLVAWKTNKSERDPSFPAFVVHWTDYSAGRATPLDREVRTAPDADVLEAIVARLIEENVKKGWDKVA